MSAHEMHEGFAAVVGELVERHGFVPPLSVMGVADDGSMFGVRFVLDEAKLNAQLMCEHIEIQISLPINVMIVDDMNRAAHVVFRISGERQVNVL